MTRAHVSASERVKSSKLELRSVYISRYFSINGCEAGRLKPWNGSVQNAALLPKIVHMGSGRLWLQGEESFGY